MGKNAPTILDLHYPALQGTPHVGDYIRLDDKAVKEEIYPKSQFEDPASRIGRVIYVNPHQWFMMEMINCSPVFTLCERYMPEEWERDYSRTIVAASEDFSPFNAAMAMTYGLTSEEEPDYEDDDPDTPTEKPAENPDTTPLDDDLFDDDDEIDAVDYDDINGFDITSLATLEDCEYDQSLDAGYDEMDY